MNHPIRLAIVGGHRGGSFALALDHLKDRLVHTVVCDLDRDLLKSWGQRNASLKLFDDFHEMLAADVCDAVLIATPMQIHAAQAVAALNAGKHVLSEVTACVTHEEAVALVEAVERTGLTYMMAENYCYMRPHMMVRHMVEQGVFGELIYAEGMYLHDCRTLAYFPDKSMTWRGLLRRELPSCHCYPTHSFGPIAQWLGVNRTDAIDTVYSVSTPAVAVAKFAREFVGPAFEGARADYWSLGDSTSVLIKTKLGRVVSLRFDAASPRPHHMACHELQGTTAVFRTQADPADGCLLWLDGKSQGHAVEGVQGRTITLPTRWDKLDAHLAEFDHPRWREHAETASKAGHGGGDFFELEDFVNAIDGTAPCPIDIYDAVTWSSILWLSQESERTGLPVKAIDYRTH